MDTTLLQKEDKERQQLSTEIIALEAHLQQAIQRYEQTYNRAFLWKGASLLQEISNSSYNVCSSTAHRIYA